MKSTRLLLALAVLVMSGFQGASGQSSGRPLVLAGLSAEAAGRSIFVEADARNSGYGDLEVSLEMVLRSAGGNATQRKLRIRQLEVPQDGDKMLVVFDSPADIRGTALLSHSHRIREDDQWLFLPAIKRVKKVSSTNKSGSFVGSEFSYQDLSPPELDKYSYRYLHQAELDGVPCYLVERVALAQHYPYAKEHFWIDKEAYRVQRVEYFSRFNEVVKVLLASDYRLYENRFWKAGRMTMTNLRNNKSTELVWQDYRFRVGLDDTRDFSVNSIRRAR